MFYSIKKEFVPILLTLLSKKNIKPQYFSLSAKKKGILNAQWQLIVNDTIENNLLWYLNDIYSNGNKSSLGSSEAQVEQDLVISRALIENVFLHLLSMNHWLLEEEQLFINFILSPKPVIPKILIWCKFPQLLSILFWKKFAKCLDFLGTKRIVKQHIHNNTIIYRFESEFPPIVDLRLKIEINTREHFSVLGFKQIPFEIKNLWFTGSCKLTSYCLEELLGTKLRALYQRRKGRDLFDLYWAMIHNEIDIEKVLMCYHKYMDFVVEQPPYS